MASESGKRKSLNVRVSTWERVSGHIKGIDDSADTVINRALDALDALEQGKRRGGRT